jgi:hypothetical protein
MKYEVQIIHEFSLISSFCMADQTNEAHALCLPLYDIKMLETRTEFCVSQIVLHLHSGNKC